MLGGSPFGHPLLQGFVTGLSLEVFVIFLVSFFELFWAIILALNGNLFWIWNFTIVNWVMYMSNLSSSSSAKWSWPWWWSCGGAYAYCVKRSYSGQIDRLYLASGYWHILVPGTLSGCGVTRWFLKFKWMYWVLLETGVCLSTLWTRITIFYLFSSSSGRDSLWRSCPED